MESSKNNGAMKQLVKVKIILFVLLVCGCTSQKKTADHNGQLFKTIDKNFLDASSQYKYMMTRLPANRFPKTYYAQSDSLETSGSSWWCSGFYPGTLLYLYNQTKDQSLLTEAERVLHLL
jgi:hypothetical protein